mgnify:CR=1 FL=1
MVWSESGSWTKTIWVLPGLSQLNYSRHTGFSYYLSLLSITEEDTGFMDWSSCFYTSQESLTPTTTLTMDFNQCIPCQRLDSLIPPLDSICQHSSGVLCSATWSMTRILEDLIPLETSTGGGRSQSISLSSSYSFSSDQLILSLSALKDQWISDHSTDL